VTALQAQQRSYARTIELPVGRDEQTGGRRRQARAGGGRGPLQQRLQRGAPSKRPRTVARSGRCVIDAWYVRRQLA
jgi:hypothetical protein